MKKIILFLLIISFSAGQAQESFKKKYWITQSKIKVKGEDVVYLMKDSIIKFGKMDQQKKDEILRQYSIGSKVTLSQEILTGEKKVIAVREVVVNQSFVDSISARIPQKVSLTHCINSSVLFEEDKVYINGYLKRDTTGKYLNQSIYYYKLKNRQCIRLWFDEYTVSALVIPVKYRFKGHGLSEEFSTTINGNVLLGYSMGQSSFFYQEKIGNKSNTWKVTGGLILGASSVILNSNNTSKADVPLGPDVEIVKGLASVGVGASFSYNKINFGLFSGWDYAIGDDAQKWNYNKKPWLGVAIGYSLFNF
ncbi:hypothetical protein [Flavobacterium aquiphilum]|uniref:hypothetical protein n=1 Tax=Flavobacterium aquiphilum TaxID=3003261 RepID=UPI0024809AD8|nr:hypothetical protein [Flavobacterium aquiphilum]